MTHRRGIDAHSPERLGGRLVGDGDRPRGGVDGAVPVILIHAAVVEECRAVVADGEIVVIDPLRSLTERYLDDAADLGARLTYAVDTRVRPTT